MHAKRISYPAARAICITLLVVAHAAACEDEHPPAVQEPEVERSLVDADDRTVLHLRFDPRGLSGLTMADAPTEPWMRGGDTDSEAWDYREWQWWKGHPWGDSCRPRYWTSVDFSAGDRNLAIRYHIDGFDCRQTFLLPEVVDRDRPHWDLVTSIRNDSGHDVKEYGQFFACYTNVNASNSFWFWEAGNRLTRFSEHGVQHLDGFVVHPGAYFLKHGAIPHFPRGGGKIVSQWHRPVLVSHASPAGWRSVILVEAAYAAGLAQGIRGAAMDYFVFPGPTAETFDDQAEFAVHVRHHLIQSADLPSTETLDSLWEAFEASHAAIHEQAQSP